MEKIEMMMPQIKSCLDMSDDAIFENWNRLEHSNIYPNFRWSTGNSRINVRDFGGTWFLLKIFSQGDRLQSFSCFLDGKIKVLEGEARGSIQEFSFFVPPGTKFLSLQTQVWRPSDSSTSKDERNLGVGIAEACYVYDAWSIPMVAQNSTELFKRIEAMEWIQYVERMRKRFRVMDVQGDGGFVRVGNPNDGGYVMWNDFSGVERAYSIGIDGDVSWDMDMAQRGIEIYMYDHTIENLKETHQKFKFFRKGLAGKFLSEHPELETLPRLIRENGHENDNHMILKMDIEGCELDVLEEIDLNTLRQFSQVVIEFHGLCNMELENKISIGLDKLNTVYQLVHVHGNNCGQVNVQGGYVFPDVLEATYLRRDRYTFKPSFRYFPDILDAPNDVGKEDVHLGKWG